MIHENIELTGSFTVSGSFVLPSHASSSAVYETGSMYHDTVEGVLKVYTGTQWVTVGEQTGPVVLNTDIEYLLVAGGGGGGGQTGGGGGAGGYLSSSLSSVTSGSSYTVIIGGGGAKCPAGTSEPSTVGTNGDDSSLAGATISTIVATGGGRGGSYQGTRVDNLSSGLDGGSGGGGAALASSIGAPGGSGTNGQGSSGAAGRTNFSGQPYFGGGGGGAGAVGTTNLSVRGGDGGDGKQSNITGTLTYYAGGGGGCGTGYSGYTTPGNGGQGGGATGGNNATPAVDATANTGGGGGGGRDYSGVAGGASNGGSGVAIFAYDSGSFNCAGGIVGDAGNGRKYNQFISSGDLKVGSTSDFSIVTDSLTLHLDAGDFTSRGTSTWTDLSGNTNNGTVNNATLGSNFYYTLNGSTSTNIVGSSSGITGNTARSVEAWYQLSNIDDIIINLGNQSFGGNTEWSISPNGTSCAVYGGIGTYDEYLTGFSTNLTAGNWIHLVVTWDANNPGTLRGYVNGVLESTSARSSGEAYSTDAGYEVGGWPNNDRPYNGNIAQIRVYSKALSATEVLQNYNATKTNFV